MASIVRRNGRYQVRWRSPDGRKQHSRTFDRQEDAKRWVTKVGHDNLTGGYVDPHEGRVSFRVFAERWRVTKMHRDSTRRQVASYLTRHAYPVLGEMPLARIRPTDVQSMVATAATKLQPASVEVLYGHVTNIFKAAVRDRVLVASPCVGIDLPAVANRRLELLEATDVKAAVDLIGPGWRVAIVLAAGAGLRPSEVLGLTVDRVDFLRRTVTVDRQLYKPKGRPAELVEPKTPESRRVLPVPESVTDAVAAHLAAVGRSEGLVVLSPRGLPSSVARYDEAWRAVKDSGGVPAWSMPYDLRHFYASMLIASGLDVKTVQRRMGHRSATTTLDVYGRLFASAEDRTRDVVEATLGAAFRG